MIISPAKIHDQGIVTKITNPEKQVGSDGIDLTVKMMARVLTDTPAIISENKAANVHRLQSLTAPATVNRDGVDYYVLTAGVYDVVFNEGCNLPKGVAAELRLRSSFVRQGCIGVAGLYDAGFHTDHIGMFVHVFGEGLILVEKNVRLAQIVCYESDSSRTYDGQYQGQIGSNWLANNQKNINQNG